MRTSTREACHLTSSSCARHRASGWDSLEEILEEHAGFVRSKSAPHVLDELHMDDLHAPGPCDMLRETKNIVVSSVAVKHATIFPIGENVTFEHLL